MSNTAVIFPSLSEIGASMQPSRPTGAPMSDYFGGMTTGAPSLINSFNTGIFGNATFYNSNGVEQGLKANEVIPHHFVLAPNLNPRESNESANAIKVLGPGMLLFARKHHNVAESNEGNYSQSSQITTSASTEFKEWTQLARWLANHSDRYMTAWDVISEWKFAGGLKIEVNPNKTSNYGKRAVSRMVNATVRGPFDTFNIWASRLKPGQPVFFLVVKGPVDSCFAGVGTGKPVPGNYQMASFDFLKYGDRDEGEQAKKKMRMSSDAFKKEVERYVWKVVPWTHPYKSRPDAEELSYYDIVGDKVVRLTGQYVRAGYAMFSEGAEEPGHLRANGDYANTIGLFNRGMLSPCQICIGL